MIYQHHLRTFNLGPSDQRNCRIVWCSNWYFFCILLQFPIGIMWCLCSPVCKIDTMIIMHHFRWGRTRTRRKRRGCPRWCERWVGAVVKTNSFQHVNIRATIVSIWMIIFWNVWWGNFILKLISSFFFTANTSTNFKTKLQLMFLVEYQNLNEKYHLIFVHWPECWIFIIVFFAYCVPEGSKMKLSPVPHARRLFSPTFFRIRILPFKTVFVQINKKNINNYFYYQLFNHIFVVWRTIDPELCPCVLNFRYSISRCPTFWCVQRWAMILFFFFPFFLFQWMMGQAGTSLIRISALNILFNGNHAMMSPRAPLSLKIYPSEVKCLSHPTRSVQPRVCFFFSISTFDSVWIRFKTSEYQLVRWHSDAFLVWFWKFFKMIEFDAVLQLFSVVDEAVGSTIFESDLHKEQSMASMLSRYSQVSNLLAVRYFPSLFIHLIAIHFLIKVEFLWEEGVCFPVGDKWPPDWG